MLHKLATKLYLNDTVTGVAYSAPVEVRPEDALDVQATVVWLEAAVLQVRLEASNDGQNWTEPDSATYVSINAVGYGRTRIAGVGARLARLRFEVLPTGNNAAIVVCSGGIVTEDQPAASFPRSLAEEYSGFFPPATNALREPPVPLDEVPRSPPFRERS